MRLLLVIFILLSSYSQGASSSNDSPGKIFEKQTSGIQNNFLSKIFRFKSQGKYFKAGQLIEEYLLQSGAGGELSEFHEALIILYNQLSYLQGRFKRAFYSLRNLSKYEPFMGTAFYLRWNLSLRDLAARLSLKKEYDYYHSNTLPLKHWVIKPGVGCPDLAKCLDRPFPKIMESDLQNLIRFPWDNTIFWLPVKSPVVSPVTFMGDKWQASSSYWIYSEFNLDTTGEIDVLIGLEGLGLVRIDGRTVFVHDYDHSFNRLQFAVRLKLKKGRHCLQVMLQGKGKKNKFTIRIFQDKKIIRSLPFEKWRLVNLESKKATAFTSKDLAKWQQDTNSFPFFLKSQIGIHPVLRALVCYNDKIYSKKFPIHTDLLTGFSQGKLLNNLTLKLSALYYLALFSDDINIRGQVLDKIINQKNFSENDIIEALFQKARRHYSLNQFDDFYKIIEKILDLNPGFIQAHKAKISYLRSRGWLRELRIASEKFRQHVSSESFHYYLTSSSIHRALGLLNKQKQDLEKLQYLNLFPSEPSDELLNLYFLEGKALRYISLLTKKSYFSDNSNQYLKKIASFRYQNSNYPGALAVYEKILKTKPFDYRLHLELAKVNEALGSKLKIIYHLNAARILNPTSEKVLIALASSNLAGFQKEKKNKFKEGLKRFEPYIAIKEASQIIQKINNLNDSYNKKSVPDAFYKDFNNSKARYLHKEKITIISKGRKKLEYHREIIQVLKDSGIKPFRTFSITFSPKIDKVILLEASVRNSGSIKSIISRGSRYNILHSQNQFEQSLSDPDSKLYYNSKAKIYVMPSVRVGSILTFSYIKESKIEKDFGDYISDSFDISGDYPVFEARYTLINKTGKKIYFKVRNTPDVNKNIKKDIGEEVYIFTSARIASHPRVDFAPPKEILQKEIIFSSFRDWSGLGLWMNKLISDRFTVDLEWKKSFLKGLHGLTRENKIRKILDWVTMRIRYVGLEYGIGGYRPRPAKEIAQTGFGDCKDMSTLAVGMLRESGIRAYIALVRTKDRGPVDKDIPYLGAFNHAIIFIEASGDIPPGKQYFYDATSDYSGFGELPWANQGTEAFILSERPRFEAIPGSHFSDNETIVYNEGKILGSGTLLIKRNLLKKGQYAIASREYYLNKMDRKKIIQEYWNKSYPNNKLTNLMFSNLKDKAKPVKFSYRISIPGYTDTENNIIMVKPFLFTSDMLEQFALKPLRKYPLVLSFPYRTFVQTKLEIPSHWKIEQLPNKISKNDEYWGLGFKYKIEKTGGKRILKIESWIEIKSDNIPLEEYSFFRKFCALIDERERDWIIFHRTKP